MVAASGAAGVAGFHGVQALSNRRHDIDLLTGRNEAAQKALEGALPTPPAPPPAAPAPPPPGTRQHFEARLADPARPPTPDLHTWLADPALRDRTLGHLFENHAGGLGGFREGVNDAYQRETSARQVAADRAAASGGKPITFPPLTPDDVGHGALFGQGPEAKKWRESVLGRLPAHTPPAPPAAPPGPAETARAFRGTGQAKDLQALSGKLKGLGVARTFFGSGRQTVRRGQAGGPRREAPAGCPWPDRSTRPPSATGRRPRSRSPGSACRAWAGGWGRRPGLRPCRSCSRSGSAAGTGPARSRPKSWWARPRPSRAGKEADCRGAAIH
jgi:hypothetical protein